MSSQPTLAQHVAAMRTDLQSQAARLGLERTLLAALHLLIHAALLRLLGRLEDMLTLWQSGLLPRPAPATRRPPRARATRQRHVVAKKRKKESSFSVEKEAKRLSSICRERPRPDPARLKDESFLVLFFKKEPLPFARPPPTPQNTSPHFHPIHALFVPYT
jgi:hypothetical protein